MLIEKKIINSKTSINYKYYDYNYENTINHEIKRRDVYKALNKLFKKNFNTNVNLIDLYHLGYANNNNNLDPVICTDIDKKYYDRILEKDIDLKIIDQFNHLSKIYIKLIHLRNDSERNDIKINKLNNKLLKITLNNKESVLIHKTTYNHMFNRLKIFDPQINYNSNKTKEKIFLVLFRNHYINNLTGMSAALPPKYLNFLKNKYDLNLELFGSAFNSFSKYYFGLFYDIEKDFGCLGNFFNSKINKGFFYMNPPFVNWLMNYSFEHILNNLKDASNKITVMVLVPVWKKEDRIHLNKICNPKLSLEDYKDIFNVDILRGSKFKIYNRFWCKEDFKYLNYFNYQKINYAPSNIFIVSNHQKNIDMNFFKPKIG